MQFSELYEVFRKLVVLGYVQLPFQLDGSVFTQHHSLSDLLVEARLIELDQKPLNLNGLFDPAEHLYVKLIVLIHLHRA